MINFIKKNLTLALLFLLILNNLAFSKINSKIILKINNEIITNIDLENEKKFLIFLNPNLISLSNDKIKNISINSLQNRKIKEVELKKYYDLNNDELGNTFIKNFISRSGYNNENNLKKILNKNKLNYKFFKNNITIDNLWREFIFNKFKSQVKVDVDKLRKQIQTRNTETEELNLSEILFRIETNKTLDTLKNQIFLEIDKSGFEAAASIFSISDSKNYGGKLGWIKSNQLSEKIYSIIKNTEEITNPIKTNNGYLILKINEKRLIKEEINIEEELRKLFNAETEKELNKLGYIYFNKIKRRIFVSEN
tara:strand:+ start:2350 stop:3276 length:927 start_codon:yes stop_codon:yes gene_type:complete